MNIIQGRGNKRRVIELPCGAIFAQAAKAEPREYASALNAVMDYTLGSERLVKISAGRLKQIAARTVRYAPPDRTEGRYAVK
jgi:hypothetical protein